MNKKPLPPEFNYAEVYLTLRCNFGCDYCINKFDSEKTKREEISGDKWLKLLNNIDFGDIPITLGGGEPTIHPDFFQIVNGLEAKVDLLTNLSFDVKEFIDLVSPDRFTKGKDPFYHPIRVSYHVGQTDEGKVINDTKLLRENGFNAGIFGLFHPHNVNENTRMAWLCSQDNIPFYLKDFLGKIDGTMYGYFKYPDAVDSKKQNVWCRSRELLISPEGNIHRCHKDLYDNKFQMSNFDYAFKPCNSYGQCNPCDVKLKTNKFLNKVECQVEVKK